MKKYRLTNVTDGATIGTYPTKLEAIEAMNEEIEKTNEENGETKEEGLTPFDFKLETVEVENPLNEKEWKEKMFRKQIAESTRKMIETLTIAEQMRVSFVPLIITHLAWVYADKAMECAARDKVSLLKKLSRTLKMVHQKYNEELRRELDYTHQQNVVKQTEMCMDEISRDLTILYFSVNQELKRKVPQYGFDEQRTYAIISTLFIDLLKQHNREMDKLLAEKLNDRNLAPSIVPPLTQHLHTGMVAFAGVEGKFDYREQNVVMAMKVIKNRIDSIEFSVF